MLAYPRLEGYKNNVRGFVSFTVYYFTVEQVKHRQLEKVF